MFALPLGRLCGALLNHALPALQIEVPTFLKHNNQLDEVLFLSELLCRPSLFCILHKEI